MDHPEVREILGGDRLRDFRGAATPSLHRGNSMISFRVPSGGGGVATSGNFPGENAKHPSDPTHGHAIHGLTCVGSASIDLWRS